MTRVEELADARASLARVDNFLASLQAAAPVVETRTKPADPSLINPKGLQKPTAFYDYVRGDKGELFPTMNQSQADGVDRLLLAGAGKLPVSWMAYVLATAYHETARTMQPVREGLNVSDNWRRKNLRYFPWYGRGDVQLTWEYNYKLATEKLQAAGFDVDLIAHPDDAMRPDASAFVIVTGMIEGWFTKKSLRDYIPAAPERQHFVNARRIINATDKADLIAGYAIEFMKALVLGDWR